MEVSRENRGALVIPLVIAESEGGFSLASPGGFFGERTLEIMPGTSGCFSAKVKGRGVHEIPSTHGLFREFYERVGALGWIGSRVEVTRRVSGETIIKLHCPLPGQDGNRNTTISVAVSQGDLAIANVLTRALFEPPRLTAMVSARGL